MKVIIRYLSRMFEKEASGKTQKETTRKYARDVINKYEKTLKRLSYE